MKDDRTKSSDKSRERSDHSCKRAVTMQWIPTSEHLPDENDWYICSVNSEIMGDRVFVYKYEDGHWLTGSEVVAWMRLPKLYEG